MNTKHIPLITRILFWCAGVDVELISTCSRTVILKYASLGGLVLTPALLAFPSASYFLLETLLPKTDWAIYTASSIGFIWGLIVLNFDRYLVISFNKTGNAVNDLLSFSVIMRIVMAGFISFVIAHPLVIAMFRGNLEESLFNSKAYQRTAIVEKYDASIKGLDDEINALIAKNAEKRSLNFLTEDSSVARELKGKIEAKQQEIHTSEIEYADEVGGYVKSRTQLPGVGPTALSIKEHISTLKTDLAQLNTELNEEKAKQAENSQLRRNMQIQDNQSFEKMRAANNILIQEKIQDLDKLKTDKMDALQKFENHVSYDFLTLSNELDALSKSNKNVFLWKWLLTGLLFVIDLFAVLLKILSDKDDYDDKKQTESYLKTSNQKAKRDACLKSEDERVSLEYKKEHYQVKQAEIQLTLDFNLDRLNRLTSFMENINNTTNRFNKLFNQHNLNPAYAKTIIEEYSEISNTIFNDVLNQFRMTAAE